ncbi:non-homologous end-joining factor 1 [Spea bombifrons]|uniref:non-homologous end-joining factor 1 n=1 Tax=Spea bombifrons TaxID=233779 RepID=UPI00234B6469|nr:non-homologous end-joining factor 1 [Spea bombifrons]
MALSHEMEGHLLKLPWRSLLIGDSSFLGKVYFTDSSYALLLTDLHSVWCEEAQGEVIQERSRELNKRLKAPISSFLGHLSQLMSPFLESMNDGLSGFTCHRGDGELTLKVKSQLSGLPFYWDFHCKEASVATVCCHFVRPLMSVAEALDRQTRELCDLLGRKDAEIQDYQESGAVLTRGRLKTEIFDEVSFRESFLAQMTEKRNPRNELGFSEHLQQLYHAVTTPELEPHPVGGGGSHNVPPVMGSLGEDTSQAAERDPSPTRGEPVQGAGQTEPQVPPSPARRPPVAVSKPKKKKAKGLFT